MQSQMPPEELTTDARRLTQQLLHETREELARADGKAQILLAATGVVVGVVLGGAISGDWRPTDLDDCARIVWWIGVGAVAVGIGALAFAIYPRLLESDDSRITYFEDVRLRKNCDELAKALNAEAIRGDRDLEQLLRLGKVAHWKYRAVQVAIGALVLAAVLCSSAALFG